MNQVQARPLAERRKAAMERLRSNSNLWLATASDGRGPHLIPLSHWWDGFRLTTATFEGSRTLKNVRAQPKVRAAIGTTGDVLMIDATATIATVADIADIAEVAKRYAQASGTIHNRCRASYTSSSYRSGSSYGRASRSSRGGQ